MARQVSLALGISLLLLSCGCAVVGTSSGGNYNATGVAGNSDGSTTDKIEFGIEQTETPVTVRQNDISVRFDMTLKNVTKSDLKLRRIELESLGEGPVTILPTRWNYDKTLRPGQTERIQFWAKAIGRDWQLGAQAPMVTRSTVLFDEEDAEPTEALFTRTLNGNFAVAIRVGG